MNRISAIVTKELRLFASDKQQLFFGLLMPLAIIAMMVGAFGGGQPLNITGYVLDLDNTAQSAALIDGLDGIVGINLRVLDATEAAARLERSDIASYLVIPEGFAQGIAAGDVNLMVQRRGNGGSDGQIFGSFAVAVASDLAADAQQYRNVLANLDTLGLTYDAAVVSSVLDEFRQAAADQPRVSMVMDSAGERGEGASFFLPGIVAMFALFTVALGSENIVSERKSGTLERLMTTRLSKAELLTGKFLAFGVRTLLQVALLFAIGWIWFGLFTPATFAQTLLFSVAVAGAGAAFGLLVSAIARSQEQAVWGSVIITNVSAMLGGSFVAIDPDSIIGKLGRFTLNYHANAGYRALVGAGASFDSPEVWQSFLILLGAAAVLLLLAIPAFRVRGDA
jgi:ABC-2 type transport system permease protein